jgi:hypothetical protein
MHFFLSTEEGCNSSYEIASSTFLWHFTTTGFLNEYDSSCQQQHARPSNPP